MAAISPMECRLLSELLRFPQDGASPTYLAHVSGFARPSTYVLLSRLRQERYVTPLRAGAERSQVRYRITARGAKARERFAREMGLRV